MNETEKKAVVVDLPRTRRVVRRDERPADADYREAIEIWPDADKLRQAIVGDAPAGSPAVAAVNLKAQRNLIGTLSSKGNVLAWNYAEGLGILVSGSEQKPGLWQLRLERSGSLRMMASVFGGRATACRLCRFIRYGMTSRAKKLRHNPNRRKAEGK